VFVDASFWVAISDTKDQWHARAKEVAPQIRQGAKVLDLAASEALTIIGSRRGGKPARRLFQVLLDSYSLVFVDPELLDGAMERHLTYDGRLSVTDCATVEAMVRLRDRTLVSFDSGFDTVKGLGRIH